MKIILYLASVILGFTSLSIYAASLTCPATTIATCSSTAGLQVYQLNYAPSGWTSKGGGGSCSTVGAKPTATVTKAASVYPNTAGKKFSSGPFVGFLRPKATLTCDYYVNGVKAGTLFNLNNVSSIVSGFSSTSSWTHYTDINGDAYRCSAGTACGSINW